MDGERQHFVPVAYLTRFCYTNFSAYQWLFFKKPRPLVTPVSVRSTCIIPDFYDLSEDSLKKFGEQQPDVLERNAFREYEANLTRVFNKFKDKQKYVSNDDWDFICNGYITQKYRTKSFQEKGGNEHRLGESYEYTMKRLGLSIDDNSKQTFIDTMRIGYRDFHIDNMYLHFRGQNDSVKNAVNFLRCYSLDVIEAASGQFFLTSDNPGFSIAINIEERRIPTNLELHYADTIIFPISSQQALKFHSINRLNQLAVLRPIRYLVASSLDMEYINTATVHISDEKVFCEDSAFLETYARRLDAFLGLKAKSK